jgi:hypothetical protein
MCSIGAKTDIIAANGPLIIKMNGMVMHNTSWIHPEPGQPHRYAQLYVLDPIQAVQNRLAMRPSLDPDLIAQIESELRENHRHVQQLRFLKDVFEEAQDADNTQSVSMLLRDNRTLDMGRFSAPVVNDIAVVFRAQDGFQRNPIDLVIHPNGGRLIRIDETHPCLDAYTYPLLNSTGANGFTPGLDVRSDHLGRIPQRKRLTMHMHYSYTLAIRRHPDSNSAEGFNPFLSAGPLTQQFVIDTDQRCLKDRLDWIRKNQEACFAAKYKDLERVVRRRLGRGHLPGRQVVLPSTFPGSPRNLQQLYIDALALAVKFGKPDLFVTITCNPAWPEIQNSLEPGQTASERPDLVARVFQMRLQQFMEDITDKAYFGKVAAFTYTVEFQKRGLPHAHIVLILSDTDKIRTRDQVDKYISAEMPDPIRFPTVFKTVAKFNVHNCTVGRCKKDANSTCQRGFPKPFQQETDIMTDSYPSYRRRETELDEFDGIRIDNRFVVPYNPYLTMLYQAHINVEHCASIKSIKYLYKYIFKGYDAALLSFTDDSNGRLIVNMDEISAFQEARFVSAPESCFRHFEFPFHKLSHVVIRLPVHLENEQTVIVDPDNLGPDSLDRGRTTMLLDFFRLNREDPAAREYKYPEIPYYYRWDDKNKKWVRRQYNLKIIARIHNVSPLEHERFALRALLFALRNVQSYQDLRRGRLGDLKASFVDAAIDHGLMEDDAEWRNCLEAAKHYKMPGPFRMLFAEICTLSHPIDFSALWEEFKDGLSEDFQHQGQPASVAYQMALSEIQTTFTQINPRGNFSNLRLPIDPTFRRPEMSELRREHNRAESREIVERNEALFNGDQEHAYFTIKNVMIGNRALDQEASRFFFIDGPGGTGKTFVYNTLLHAVRAQGGSFISVAWTGIAAMLLLEGQTSHTGFRIPMNIDETTRLHQDRHSLIWKRVQEATVIIWDEISLVPKDALNAVDYFCRSVTGIAHKPFGNKTVVVGGDFRQCLPIVKHAHRSAIVETCVKFSESWSQVVQFNLTQNMRAPGARFSEWLLEIGEGRTGNSVSIPADMLDSVDGLIDFTFGRSLTAPPSLIKQALRTNSDTRLLDEFCDSAILCPKNADTFEINDRILSIQDGQPYTYRSIDRVTSEDQSIQSLYPIEFLNSITPTGFPQHELKLKKGSPVILLRNMNIEQKLTNGTRMIVVETNPHLLVCRIVLEGKLTDRIIFLPRIHFISNGNDTPIPFRRQQFPVRVAFAMTVNKSQGQTLRRVGLALRTPCFSHGQLYVALSRVRARENVKISVPGVHGNATDVQNVVFREIFGEG